MTIRDDHELEGLRRSGRAAAEILAEVAAAAVPGVSTAELDARARAAMTERGARSAPETTYAFPGAICLSVNEEVVHGVPGRRRLVAGDLLKVDVTIELDGWITDTARSVIVGVADARARRLVACAHAAFRAALDAARAGRPVRAIGRAVDAETRRRGFRVVRELCGHGVGRRLHEDPEVPNFEDPHQRDLLAEGMVMAIEPILSAGSGRIVTAPDGWTIRTRDGALAAHHEHTVVITAARPLVLTALDADAA